MLSRGLSPKNLLGPSLCKHTPSFSLRLSALASLGVFASLWVANPLKGRLRVSALNLKNRDTLTHKRQYVSIFAT